MPDLLLKAYSKHSAKSVGGGKARVTVLTSRAQTGLDSCHFTLLCFSTLTNLSFESKYKVRYL